jgi:hypothetical protein
MIYKPWVSFIHFISYNRIQGKMIVTSISWCYSLAHQWRIKYCYFAKLRTPRFYGTLIALYSYFPQLRLFNFITTSEAFSIPSEHSTGDHIAHPPNRVNITYLLCFSDAFGTIRMRPSVPDPRTKSNYFGRYVKTYIPIFKNPYTLQHRQMLSFRSQS